jgi:serine/threonine protein kinase
MTAMTTAQDTGARRRFTVGDCLGRGGYGEVYRARMLSPGGLETEVALKVLRADLELGHDAVRRLRDEGRMLARLDHPAILRVFDLVALEGRVCLVTEMIDGADLAQLSHAGARPTPRAVLQLVSAVARALHEAYTATAGGGVPIRLVHRDVKPSNIRIGRHGQVKLVDFGIARSDALHRESRTQSDAVLGSLPYIAPERFLERESRPASDVFSLGCVLFEGLVGERFYGENSRVRVPTLALDEDAFDDFVLSRLSDLPVRTPGDVRLLLTGMLSYDPEVRPTANEVAGRCEHLGDDLPGTTLRAWTRRVSWPEPPPDAGPLAGRTLVEGDLTLAAAHVESSPDPGDGPLIHLAPRPTIDAATAGLPSPVVHRAPLPTGAALAPPSLAGVDRPLRSIDERAYTDDHAAPPGWLAPDQGAPVSTTDAPDPQESEALPTEDEATEDTADDEAIDLSKEGGTPLLIGVGCMTVITILLSVGLIAAVLFASAMD